MAGGPADHGLYVGLQVVVGEDGVGNIVEHAAGHKVPGGSGDRVGRLVDAGDAVAVLVGGDAVDLLAGRVNRGTTPVVARRAADADLHGAGRAERVGAAVNAGQRRLTVVAFHLADAGEDHPGNVVLGADVLEPEQVVSGDGVLRGGARRRLIGVAAAGRGTGIVG